MYLCDVLESLQKADRKEGGYNDHLTERVWMNDDVLRGGQA